MSQSVITFRDAFRYRTSDLRVRLPQSISILNPFKDLTLVV